MASILIVTADSENMHFWMEVLKTSHCLRVAENLLLALEHFLPTGEIDLTVIDGQIIADEPTQLPFFIRKAGKTIIVGENWSDDLQIKAVVDGAWGYSEKHVDIGLIPKIVESVLKNEFWLSRHLVPKVLSSLTESNEIKSISDSKVLSDKQLSTLTKRELDVAELVYQGKFNPEIADKLNITERTVKAHLSSIFRKLNISDRVHLIIYLKDLHLKMHETPRGTV